MMFEQQALPADARFWPAAGRAVRDFAARSGAPERRLQGIYWLVPNGPYALLARGALRNALGNVAFVPPRIAPMAAWLGRGLQAGTAARAELYAALRSNAWVREAFGDQPAALWSLARDVTQLSDELTWAAVEGHAALEGRLEASLARHFHRRAAHALRPQAQLVLQLWRARRCADDGAAGAWRELARRAERASAPLVYLSSLGSEARPDSALATWERTFLDRWSERAPVLWLVPDLAAALQGRPLLAAAWPELAGDGGDVPIALRADAVRDSEAMDRMPLALLDTDSLEEEATSVAQQVLAWRRDGIESIGLVALDRLTARRVRALLERAQVTVRDETGWRLSTTSAAASVMRWFDLIVDDLYWRDLLDWLKSSFTLSNRPNKAQEILAFERAIRARGALQGPRAIRRALADLDPDGSSLPVAGAREVLAILEEQIRTTRRAEANLLSHARVLRASLEVLGMRAALTADPVGREVLREIDVLASELSAAGGRTRVEEFRALLAARFEESAYVDREVVSPVTMVSLSAAALRGFEAVVLIGADAEHLPTAPGELLFCSSDVRAELGLATTESALRGQASQLAAVLANTPHVIATWRRCQGDEPNSLSPLLERLRIVVERATGGRLAHHLERDSFEVEPLELVCPAPSAGSLLPARLSASSVQSLVDCPYQFYARRLLRLEAPEDVLEAPGKREFGEALHEVLRRFHEHWGSADLAAEAPDRLQQSLVQYAHEVFARSRERMPGLLAFERRFLGLVDDYIDWAQQHSGAGWRWTSAEHALACTLVLDDAREVELTGRLDRVDTNRDGRVMVLDYKARAADELRSRLKIPGEDVQLPFYGLLLKGASPASGEACAAYISFERGRTNARGAQVVAPSQPFAELVGEVGARLRGDLQRIAGGAPLPALGRPATCEYCEMRGLCRRDYWEHDDEAGP